MHSQQMALITPIVIGVIKSLGKWNKFKCGMFCSVVAWHKNLDFFPTQKAVDARREVVCWIWLIQNNLFDAKSAAVIKVISVDWAGVILVWLSFLKSSLFSLKLPCCHTTDSWVWPLFSRHLCFWYCYMHTRALWYAVWCMGGWLVLGLWAIVPLI